MKKSFIIIVDHFNGDIITFVEIVVLLPSGQCTTNVPLIIKHGWYGCGKWQICTMHGYLKNVPIFYIYFNHNYDIMKYHQHEFLRLSEQCNAVFFQEVISNNIGHN